LRRLMLPTREFFISASPPFSCGHSSLTLPRTATSAEGLMARVVLILGRSLQVRSCGLVVLSPTLGSETSTLRYRKLFSSANRKVGTTSVH
jgi:hypothetical protein